MYTFPQQQPSLGRCLLAGAMSTLASMVLRATTAPSMLLGFCRDLILCAGPAASWRGFRDFRILFASPFEDMTVSPVALNHLNVLNASDRFIEKGTPEL